MDMKPAIGHRIHFTAVQATTTPKLLVGADGRHAVVFVVNGGAVRIGHSGSIASQRIYIPDGQGFTDNYSADQWWVYAASGSGSVSGFIVV
jgi:hypothetical protein